MMLIVLIILQLFRYNLQTGEMGTAFLKLDRWTGQSWIVGSTYKGWQEFPLSGQLADPEALRTYTTIGWAVLVGASLIWLAGRARCRAEEGGHMFNSERLGPEKEQGSSRGVTDCPRVGLTGT